MASRPVRRTRLSGRHVDVSLARRARALGEEALRRRVLAAEGRGEPDGIPTAELALAEAEDEVARAEEALVVARLQAPGDPGRARLSSGVNPRRIEYKEGGCELWDATKRRAKSRLHSPH